MKKIYLYGAGAALNRYSAHDMAEWLNHHYRILGLIDRNPDIQGKEIVIGGRKIEVQGLEALGDAAPIGITSSRFYDEIKRDLISRQIDEERILPDQFLYDEYLSSVFDKIYFEGNGVEIGGPSTIFESIYKNCNSCDGINFATDTVWGQNAGNAYRFKETILGRQIIADATDLSCIEGEKYDFALSSNNLEHIANPLKAILEMKRIVKTGGAVLFLVPNKEFTFDHKRKFTSFEHLLEDYQNKVEETDLTHLEEILENHDLTMDIDMSIDEFRERSRHNFENRCLHHHVFSSETLNRIVDECGFSVIKSGKISNCFYALGTKLPAD